MQKYSKVKVANIQRKEESFSEETASHSENVLCTLTHAEKTYQPFAQVGSFRPPAHKSLHRQTKQGLGL